jgi:Tfp pilus assembly protein PilF
MQKLIQTLILLLLVGCSSLSKNVPENERKAEIYYGHGTNKLVEKDYTSALDLLIKSEKLNPNDTKTQNNLGMAYFFKQQYQESKNHFVKAIEIDKKNSDARNNLASLYYHLGKYQLAEKQYLITLKDLVYPAQYRVHYNLGLIYLKKGQTNMAIKQINIAIEQKQDYCPAFFTLGEIEKGRRQWRSALNYFIKGSKGVCYDQPAVHYEQGLAYIELKNYHRAEQKFVEISDKFPTTRFSVMAERKVKRMRSPNFLKEQIEHESIKINGLPDTDQALLQGLLDR